MQPLNISSNSPNLLRISTVQLLYTVKEKGIKPDRKPYFPEVKEIHTEISSLILSRLCSETSTKLFVHEFGFRTIQIGGRQYSKQQAVIPVKQHLKHRGNVEPRCIIDKYISLLYHLTRMLIGS
jgi:hypothetical protein